MTKFIIFILFFLTIFLFILYSYGFLITHIIPINSNFVLSINPGDNLNTMLRYLKNRGLYGNFFIIKIYTRLFYRNLVIKVGSYQVYEYYTYWRIIQDIDKGIGILLKLTIPPGLRIDEIARLFADKNIVSKEQFYSIINGQDFLISSFEQNLNLLDNPEILNYWQKFKINIKEKKFEGFFTLKHTLKQKVFLHLQFSKNQ